MGTPCTSRLRLWNGQTFSDWSGSHAPQVHSTIVDGERWLMESSRTYCPFNLVCEERFGNLVQCFTHSVISQAFARWALISTFMMVFFIVGKRLAGWSSWPLPITSILHLQRKCRSCRGFILAMHGTTSSLTGQSPVAWLCYVALERHDFQLESGFCLYT